MSNFNLPSSTSAVQVRIIDTTSTLNLPKALSSFVQPPIPGHEDIVCPSFSFLIEHPTGRKLLFDLGIRKDYENLAPVLVEKFQTEGWELRVEKGVREQLEEHDVKGSEIEAIIWSHAHFDHTGDPSTFDSNTALVVGPGFREGLLPAYPQNAKATIRESDFVGRELHEINFTEGINIGRFKAIDYFGDGSFYLLDAPGHAIGHLCGLARVTTSPASFIFMGGDFAHHGGEFRPSEYLPLPSIISPHPFHDQRRNATSTCPGSLFESLLREGDRSQSFYKAAQGDFTFDPDMAEETVGKVQEADAREDTLVVIAHDDTLPGIVDFFPKYANEFVKKGWVKRVKWAFLKDFRSALE